MENVRILRPSPFLLWSHRLRVPGFDVTNFLVEFEARGVPPCVLNVRANDA